MVADGELDKISWPAGFDVGAEGPDRVLMDGEQARRFATSVPRGALRWRTVEKGRGRFERVLRAGSVKEFDAALTDALGLPSPEKQRPA